VSTIRSVLVVDDDVAPSQVKAWFRNDATERPEGEHFELYLVCETEQELQDELTQAPDALPDLILIDDRIQAAAGMSPERKALDIVTWITRRFGDARPHCVLTTATPAPTFSYAFCELGGHNVIDKHQPHERLRIMWETIDGKLWTPPGGDTAPFSVLDKTGLLLPYMEHPGWKPSALRELGLKEPALAQRKSRLAEDLGISGKSDRSVFVDTANALGIVWVPLIDRHLLPAGHPEHRVQRFVPDALVAD
jgi:hypothetical protein